MTNKTSPGDAYPIVIGVEIVTRRRYAVHAKTEQDAEGVVQSLLRDANPTIINAFSDFTIGSALALDRPQSSSERISLDNHTGDGSSRRLATRPGEPTDSPHHASRAVKDVAPKREG